MGSFGLPGNGAQVLRYTDKLIAEQKADNRGVVIQAVQAVLTTSLDQWRITEDPRYLEMILRAADRLIKLGRLLEPDGPVVLEGVDTDVLVATVRRDLAALEQRMNGDGG